MVRGGPGGLPDGSLVYRFGGWFGSRRARRIARRLVRGASADGSDGDGPGVFPDGLLAALRRMVRFETGPAYCPTARPRRFGGRSSDASAGILISGSYAAATELSFP